jgi:hypothetical protein
MHFKSVEIYGTHQNVNNAKQIDRAFLEGFTHFNSPRTILSLIGRSSSSAGATYKAINL